MAAKAGKDITVSKTPEDVEAEREAQYVSDLSEAIKGTQMRCAG